jgi:hypothetical protein
MQEAWGEFNFIPVLDYPSLNNGGDSLGLWNDETEYETDVAGNPNVFTNAVATITYQEGAGGWPETGGANPGESIFLSDLSLNPALAASWVLASDTDGLSYFPNEVTGTQNIHPGGDVGSPGTFVIVPPGVDGDFNEDGEVDAADYVMWRKDNSVGTYEEWVANFGESAPGAGGNDGGGGAVPEPASFMLVGIGLAALCFRRRVG